MSVVVLCACPLCDWQHGETTGRLEPGALAGVVGFGVMESIATNNMHERMEKALEQHLNTHALVEWVRAVSSRDALIASLREPPR